MNDSDKYIVKILMELKKEFGQNRNYSTNQIHDYINDVIKKHK